MCEISQCSLMKQQDVPFGKTFRTALKQELKEHLLPATSHITGSRAPRQGLDLGRDIGSQIQVFKNCHCRYPGAPVSASRAPA